ncbi:hypothetical protein SALBM311S_06250 [Streptomyces alboniger]
MIHLKPCPRTFGAAQYRIAIMRVTSTISTGHFAIDQAVRVVSPMPSAAPASRARPPVNTTISALITASTSSTTVTPTRTGSSFHTGRPSGMSYTAFALRMKAAM